MHDQKRLKGEKGHVLAYRGYTVMMAGKAGYWECEADMGIRKQRDHIHPHTGSGGGGQEVGPGSTGIPPPAYLYFLKVSLFLKQCHLPGTKYSNT